MIENDNAIFLRTVLRKDIFNRLTEFAKSFETGYGKWDYGVAIQFLLDFYEQQNNISSVNNKLDAIMLSLHPQEVDEEKEESGTEMFGGEVLVK